MKIAIIKTIIVMPAISFASLDIISFKIMGYDGFGNDAIAHLSFFYLISYTLKLEKKSQPVYSGYKILYDWRLYVRIHFSFR